MNKNNISILLIYLAFQFYDSNVKITSVIYHGIV